MVHISFWFMLMMLIYTVEWKRNIIKKITDALVVASKETGLELNADKTKYVVMSRDQNARRGHNM